jgi:hypothetical protein
MRRVMLTAVERRYVPRNGQSIFPGGEGGRDVKRIKITPYTNSDERI